MARVDPTGERTARGGRDRTRRDATLERYRSDDVRRDPRVSLLVVDPEDTARFIAIRGEVEIVSDGAIAHLDALTRSYTRHPAFYGGVRPAAWRDLEHRVIWRIHPRRITLDAIHAGSEGVVGDTGFEPVTSRM